MIKATQASTKQLSASMSALGREGRSAAQEWQKAAAAMERAAQAANRASGAAMRPSAGGMGLLPAPGPTGAPRRTRSAGQPALDSYYYGQSANAGQVRLNNEASGQFQLVGPPRGGPGRELVPVPGTQRTHDYATSPDRGSLVPYVAPGLLGPHLGQRGGFTFPAGDEPFDADGRIPLYPNGKKGRFDPSSPRRSSDHFAQGVSAYGGFELFKSMYDASAEVDDLKRGLENQGFSIPQVDVIAKKSEDLRKSEFGTSTPGNMKAFSKAMEVFQNTDEAIEATPAFVHFDRLMTASNHGKEGDEILNALRLAEYRGAVMRINPKTGEKELDKAALKEMLDMVAASSLMTNGDIGVKQVLQTLRASGTAGSLIDNRTAFVDMMALQVALGQSKAGSALQGFAQQWVFGRQSKAAIDVMIADHIIKGGGTAKTNKYIKPVGFGQYLLLPGAMPDGVAEKARDQPVEFVENYLRPLFQKMLTKEFGKKYTNASPEEKIKYETASGGIYASRIPGATDIAESIRNYLLILRDREANLSILKRGIPAAYETRINGNPMIQQDALSAAYKDFLRHLGDAALKPAVDFLNDMTKWLDKLGAWAKDNPEKIKVGLEAFAGAIALFAAGTVYAGALAVLTGSGGLIALAGGIETLGRAFSSLPGPLIDAAAGAALGARFGPIGAGVGGLVGLGAGYMFGPGSSNAPAGPGGAPQSFGTNFGFDPSMYGINPNAPSAPRAQLQGGDKGVQDVRVVNSGDHANGVAKSIGNRMNRPPDGPTSPNVNLSPGGAYFGSTFAPP